MIRSTRIENGPILSSFTNTGAVLGRRLLAVVTPALFAALTLTVPAQANDAPVVLTPPTQINVVGDTVNLEIMASDPDGDEIKYGASHLPNGLTIDPHTGVISGQISGSVGEQIVEVVVSDETEAAEVAFIWVVHSGPVTSTGAFETVTVSGVSNTGWAAVPLQNVYVSMVVSCTANYKHNTTPIVVRMRNAFLSSFEIQLDSPSNAPQPDVLPAEEVFCVAIEEGDWELPNGESIEAHKYASTLTDRKNAWFGSHQMLENAYQRPAVLGQVMSSYDFRWSVFWSRGETVTDPASNVLYTGKHVGDDPETGREHEIVGYIVTESAHDTMAGTEYEFGTGPDIVVGYDNANVTAHPFIDLFTSGTPVVGVVSQTGMDGGDGGWGMLTPVPNFDVVIGGGGGPFGFSHFGCFIDEDQLDDTERYHTTEQLSYFAATAHINVALGGTDPPVLPEATLETIDVDGVDSDSWTSVTLQNSYENPVIVCTPQLLNNTIPMVVRMRNAAADSFEIRLQNPSDQALAPELVRCIAAEEGVWTLADGTKLEAHRQLSTVTDGKNSWNAEAGEFNHEYAAIVVLGQVMTYEDPAWSVFWTYGPDRTLPPDPDKISVGKHVGQDPDTDRADETLGYIILESTRGEIDGVEYEFSVGPDTLRGYDNAPFDKYPYMDPFVPAPQTGVVVQAAMDGNDGSWGLFSGAPTFEEAFMLAVVDEDQSDDAERSHTTEQLGYAVFSEPVLFELFGDDPVDPPAVGFLETLVLPSASISTTANATFENEYIDPVAVCSPRIHENDIPLVVRIRELTSNSISVSLQNPSGEDLQPEQIHCLVMERGAWRLPDGRAIEAGIVPSFLTDGKNNWGGQPVAYEHSYVRPVVLGQVMSDNDPRWSVFWSHGASVTDPPSSSSLFIGKHVGADPDTDREGEQIGYVVIEAGHGNIAGNEYEARVGEDTVRGYGNAPAYAYEFMVPFATLPSSGIVTQAGMDGGDGGWGLFSGDPIFKPNGISVVVDEDQIEDSERYHTTEQLAYLVFGEPANIQLLLP